MKLSRLIKASGNEFADVGVEMNDINGFVDTGSYIFNALVSGSIYKGIPDNKIIALAGESSVGKTFFALSIVNHFLSNNPDAFVIYFDSESAVTSDIIKNHNINSDQFSLLPIDTIEKFRTQSTKILDEYMKIEDRPPMMMVLDSLGMLSTNKESEDVASGDNVRDMTRPALVKGAFRVLTLKLAKAKVPMILTNHVYATMSPYGKKSEMGGGAGLKYAASIIVNLSKKRLVDKKDSKNLIGANIVCELLKSRVTKEGKKIETKLFFDKGLDLYHGLLEFCIKHEIIFRNGPWYSIDDIKFQTKQLEEEPEKYFTPEILEKINKCAEREFCYGQIE